MAVYLLPPLLAVVLTFHCIAAQYGYAKVL